MTATIEVDAEVIPTDDLEAMLAAGSRCELALLERGVEVMRTALYLPRMPTFLGDKVVTSEPSVFHVTVEKARLDRWKAYPWDANPLEGRFGPLDVIRGDSIECMLSVRGRRLRWWPRRSG